MRYLVLTIALLISPLSYSLTIDELYTSGQLAIDYRIVEQDKLVQYQPVTLEV